LLVHGRFDPQNPIWPNRDRFVERHDHVRKYDDVAQRQYRIGPGFTWRKR
jgi:hypothetical protein